MQEVAITWSRFNIMVAANSVIITGTGVAASHQTDLYWLARALPIAGFLLCIMWIMMMIRAFMYHELWRTSTCEIEKEFSESSIRTLEKAILLRSKAKLKAVHYAIFVIIIFLILYLVAIIEIFRSSVVAP